MEGKRLGGGKQHLEIKALKSRCAIVDFHRVSLAVHFESYSQN